ncbi:TniB family NTP-binding protein [Amphritea sp.]|uniref:TniB family NTP-binding protein n=1 Tax=Amphritea sp. TaxID=1872502 RepID=UPI003A92FF4F
MDQKQRRLKIIKALKLHTIQYEMHLSVLKAIGNTHDMSGTEGSGMLLLGMPGVGKTRTIEKYIETYMKGYGETESDTLTLCPIVKISIPSKPTVKGLIIKILNTVGHPALSGSEAQLDARLGCFIQKQGVEMLIFDECQHLLKEQAQVITRNVVNYIKTLMDEHKLAIVMSGLPEAKSSITQFEELYQRFTAEHIELRPFSLQSKEDQWQFSGYLNTYKRILKESGIVTIDLSSKPMQERIMLATQGVPRLINRLLEKVLSVGDLDKTLGINDFVQAYNKAQLNPDLGTFNPFKADIIKVRDRLDKSNRK